MQMIFKLKSLLRKDLNFKQVTTLKYHPHFNLRLQRPNNIQQVIIFTHPFKTIHSKILKSILCQQLAIILRKSFPKGIMHSSKARLFGQFIVFIIKMPMKSLELKLIFQSQNLNDYLKQIIYILKSKLLYLYLCFLEIQ